MIDEDNLSELQGIYPKAKVLTEGSYQYVHIPVLAISAGVKTEALLCPQLRDGYATRLFLSSPIPDKGQNWTQHQILGRSWHSWSWQGVPADQRLVQILLGHVKALR